MISEEVTALFASAKWCCSAAMVLVNIMYCNTTAAAVVCAV
jgi:hypothetical protein